MTLRELIARLNKLAEREELLDLKVTLITETKKSQVEQALGDIAVPTTYTFPNPVGTPNRIVLCSKNFD